MAWSQKFRKSEISLDTGDSASNAVAKRSVLFLLPSVVQNMCVWTMDFVSAAKNTLSPTVCEKVVPRLNGRISTITSSNEISWKLHPPRNEELVAPLPGTNASSWEVRWWPHELLAVRASVRVAHFKEGQQQRNQTVASSAVRCKGT